jgi:predicted NBD/HSP70 family sugar kinase/copper homeostasis protein CutC
MLLMIKIEIAIEDVAGAVTAENAGAHRVEVCSDLSVGGLTPTIGMVREILRKTSSIEIVIMIRPRPGNFTYSDSEIETMVADIQAFNELDLGNRRVGFVYGVLDSNNEIDIHNLQKLIQANKSGSNCFHMAFDSTKDLKQALKVLMEHGFQRVLTSGGAGTAFAGRRMIKELKELAAGEIEIIAGGSVRPHNVREIVDATGVKEVHLRANEQIKGPGTGKYDAITLYQTSHRVIAEIVAALAQPSAKSALLVVDIGGTSLKGALLTPEFEIIHRESKPTDRSTVESDLFSLITSLRLAAQTKKLNVLSIGVISPGSIDEREGVIVFASNLDWRDYPLAANLRREFDLPVAVGHDVRSACLAEGKIGSASDSRYFVSVSIGTGIAVGIVNDGKVILGAHDGAGESGHMPVVVPGAICPCGQSGCWERYSSGHGISERYAELTGNSKKVEEIIALAGSDSSARAVWNDAISKCAQALAILTLTLDPERIVLGGGVAAGYAVVLDELQSQFQALLKWKTAPEIRVSSLGDDGGILGAAILAMTEVSK